MLSTGPRCCCPRVISKSTGTSIDPADAHRLAVVCQRAPEHVDPGDLNSRIHDRMATGSCFKLRDT